MYVTLTLNHKLVFWVGDKMKIVEADKKPLFLEVKMLKELLYSPHLSLVMVPQEYEEGALEACNLTKKCFQLKVEVNPRPFDEVLND